MLFMLIGVLSQLFASKSLYFGDLLSSLGFSFILSF